MTTKFLALSLAIVVLLNSIFAYSSGGKISENQKSFDVVFYDVDIKVDPYKKIISGEVVISFILYHKVKDIELDLINKYSISGAHINGTSIAFKHKKNKNTTKSNKIDDKSSVKTSYPSFFKHFTYHTH